MADNLQSTMVNVKTVIPLDTLVRHVAEIWPSCQIVGATHDEPGKVLHCHAVLRFEVPTRWASLRDWLNLHDSHNYSKPARSWRRSVRYLLHLDNSEKARIPRDSLRSYGIDEDELDLLLGSPKMKILDSLAEAQVLPLNQRFRYLVEQRGHLPSEVSAALRCLRDLEKWAETRQGRESALPPPSPVHNDTEEDFDDCEETGVEMGDIYD